MNENQSLKKLKRSELEDLIAGLVDSVNENKLKVLSEKNKNSLLEKIIFEYDKNEIVNRFFKDLGIKETSSIRLVYLERDYFLQRIIFSNGKNCQDYALLDDQIIEQIGLNKNLFIQDTSRIHNLRFTQGYTYPRSLVAFALINNNNKIGIAWVGDINYHAFSKQDFMHFEKVVEVYQDALVALIKKEILEEERQSFQQIVHEDENPMIIINGEHKISYANRSAVNVFDLINNENGQNLTSKIDFSPIFEPHNALEKPTIQYKEKVYEVFATNYFENDNHSITCFRFNDKTWDNAKNTYLATIISTITHYLKSPMVEIKGLAALINALGNLSEKQSGFLTQINNKINEIENSIVQLLAVDRIQKDGFVRLSKFSIRECLKNIIEILIPFAQQKQITINLSFDQGGEFIYSDKVLLKHALLNILDYAINETHLGGTIEIKQSISAEKHSIAISDSGKGISKLDVKKMMEGNNLHSDREALEITKSIIFVLNGELIIESDLGSGTTITMQFSRII